MSKNIPRWLAYILSPWAWLRGWGSCTRCRLSWKYVPEHSTDWDVEIDGRDEGGAGVFALCQHCWEGLTPEQRLGYYHKAYRRCGWEEPWEFIRGLVLAGR